MSAIRFTSQFLSDNGLIYNVEIWDRNYTGSSTKITLGSGGPKMIWESESEDRFTEILSSTCEIPLVIDNALLDEFLLDIRSSAYQERDVYVHIYFSNTSARPLWSGFLLHELASTVDEYYPYEYRLRFTDGLSLLKEIDFVQEGSSAPYDSSEIYTDYNSFTYYIKEILLKSGSALTTEGASVNYRYRTAINWFNAGHGSGAPSSTLDPMAETKVKPSVFYNEDENNNFSVMNCYDVLKTLLKHWGARITYWRHTYWITQVSSFNTLDTGTFANPVNVRQSIYNYNQITTTSRVNGFNEATTLYETFLTSIANGKAVDKIKGTIYDFMAPVKEVEATYSTGNNENFFRGFPIPSSPNSTDTVVTQGTIIDGANASDFYLNIPLQFKQDRTGSLSLLSNGAFQFVSVKMFFELSATDGASTKYLRKNTPNQGGGFSWVTSAPTSINSRPSWEYNQLNFGANPQVYYQTIGGGPDNGNAIFIPTDPDFVGAWTWSLKIFKQFNSSGAPHNDYVFTCLTTGQTTSDLSQIGLSYLNVLTQTNISQAFTNTPSGGITNQVFNLALVNNNAFAGLILALNSNAGISFSLQNILISSGNTRNSLDKDFGTLLFGDTPDNVSESAIKVDDQSGTTTFTNATGQWGVDTVSGNFTFSTLLLDEYLAGQSIPLKVGRFRLATGTKAIRQNDGTKSRLRFVNPITVLIEQQSPQDPTIRYGFIRGTFHLLAGEWDYEGFELDNATLTTTTTTTVVSGGAGPKAPDDGVIAFMTKPPNINNDLVSLNNVITTTKSAIEPIGTDLIADQYFASSSNWNLTTGWSITDNTAVLVTGEGDRTLTPSSDTLAASKNYRGVIIIDAITGTLQITDGSSVLKEFTESDGTGGHVFDFTTTAQYSALTITGDATTTTTLSFLQVNELQSTTSFDINAIGEAVFKTGDKFSLISLATGSVFDLTINSDQSASDTTLTITSTELKEIIPINSIVTFNKKNLIKQYQDDTLQEVTDNGNTTTNSIMIGSSSTPTQTLDVNGNTLTSGTTFIGDTFTKIQSASGHLLLSNLSSSGGVKFRTNSVDVVFIDSSGNVGIGTTSPSEKLEVNGNIKLGDGSQKNIIGAINNNLGIFANPNGTDEGILFSTDDGSTIEMIILNGGNVGIGTTSPYDKLQIGNSDSAPSFGIDPNVATTVSSTTNDDEVAYQLYVNDGNNNIRSKFFLNDNSRTVGFDTTYSTDFQAFVFKLVNSEVMRINSSGNLLIGTTTDFGGKLNIVGTTSDNSSFGLIIKNSIGNILFSVRNDGVVQVPSGYFWAQHSNGMFSTGSIKARGGITNDLGTLEIGGGGNTDAMNITSDGNVLIGTTSDDGSNKLQVSGTASFVNSGNGQIDITRTSGATTFIQSQSATGVVGTSTNHNLDLKTNGSTRLRITTGGNVGIGTSSPSEKLDVNGNAKIQGTIANDNFTIPNASGSAGQVLKYPSSGSTLEWGSVSGGSALTNYALIDCSDSTVASSSTDGESNAVVIPFNTKVVSGTSNTINLTGNEGIADIENSANAWYFTTAGNYEFSWTITTNTNIVNNRILSGVKLQRGVVVDDTTLTWTDYNPTKSFIYDRGTGSIRQGSTHSQTIVAQDSTQYYWRLVLWKESASNSSTTSITVTLGTNLIIKQIE